MTTYGNPSRISATVEGGGIAALDLDTAEKVVLFARGDPSSGTVSPNDPTQVDGPGGLEETFGDTQIVDYFRQVAANGIGYDMIWGVVPSKTSVTGESADATASYTLNNAPVLEDTDEISVEDDTGATITVEFRYESPPPSPSDSDTAFLNPFTGEIEFDQSDTYNIDYKYHEWQKAFDSATEVVEEQEVGEWGVASEAESVIADAEATASPLRTNQWKMIRVNAIAQPNATTQDGDAKIDPGTYSDTLDSDFLFVGAPGRAEDSKITAMGAMAGVMAGNAIDNPIIGEGLDNVGSLEQTLNVPDQEALEDEGLLPLSNTGQPAIEGNLSTSTATGWTRSFYARRLADRLLLAARALAKAARGRLNGERIETIVQTRLGDEILDLVEEGTLEPNQPNEQKWFVNAEQDDSNDRKLNVSFGFTPTGVVDTVEVDQTINY